jgi:hypothetical protein
LRRAHNVTAGLKCPPEYLPTNIIATQRAAPMASGFPMSEITEINKSVPKYSDASDFHI